MAVKAKLDSGSMAELVAAFTTQLNEADASAQNALLERNLKILDSGNFNFTSEMGILGMQETLKMATSPPKAIASHLSGLLITKAKFALDMFIQASTKHKDSVDTKTDVNTHAKGGGLFYKASIDVHAQLAAHVDNLREEEARSHVHVEIEMEQAKTPEGVLRLMDILYLFTDKVMQINLELLEVQKEQIKAKANEIAAANKGAIPPSQAGSNKNLNSYDDYPADEFPDDDYVEDEYSDDGDYSDTDDDYSEG